MTGGRTGQLRTNAAVFCGHGPGRSQKMPRQRRRRQAADRRTQAPPLSPQTATVLLTSILTGCATLLSALVLAQLQRLSPLAEWPCLQCFRGSGVLYNALWHNQSEKPVAFPGPPLGKIAAYPCNRQQSWPFSCSYPRPPDNRPDSIPGSPRSSSGTRCHHKCPHMASTSETKSP